MGNPINIPHSHPRDEQEGRQFASSNPGSPSVSLEGLSRRHNRMYSHPLPSTRWLQDSPNCLQCGRNFSWWPGARHHCRFCGQLVCGDCSRKRILYGTEDHASSFLRVCDRCFRDGCEQGGFMIVSRDLARILGGMDDLEEDVRSSPGVFQRLWPHGRKPEMDYCPGCSKAKPDQTHIRECLEKQSGKVVGDRLVIMPEAGSIPADECSICYEPLVHPVALLNCFCKYHKDCIQSWFERNPSCPLHPS